MIFRFSLSTYFSVYMVLCTMLSQLTATLTFNQCHISEYMNHTPLKEHTGDLRQQRLLQYPRSASKLIIPHQFVIIQLFVPL